MSKKIIILSLLVAFALIALPVLAKKNATPVDPACMKTAIEKRDNAIIAAVNKFRDSVVSALTARITALKAAWDKTDRNERKTAIKEAWNTYKKAAKEARLTLRTEKKAAWKQFYTDRKACGTTGASDDKTTEGVDANI